MSRMPVIAKFVESKRYERQGREGYMLEDIHGGGLQIRQKESARKK